MQESNLHLLYWQVDSLPLIHLGSLKNQPLFIAALVPKMGSLSSSSLHRLSSLLNYAGLVSEADFALLSRRNLNVSASKKPLPHPAAFCFPITAVWNQPSSPTSLTSPARRHRRTPLFLGFSENLFLPTTGSVIMS